MDFITDTKHVLPSGIIFFDPLTGTSIAPKKISYKPVFESPQYGFKVFPLMARIHEGTITLPPLTQHICSLGTIPLYLIHDEDISLIYIHNLIEIFWNNVQSQRKFSHPLSSSSSQEETLSILSGAENSYTHIHDKTITLNGIKIKLDITAKMLEWLLPLSDAGFLYIAGINIWSACTITCQETPIFGNPRNKVKIWRINGEITIIETPATDVFPSNIQQLSLLFPIE